MPSINQFCFLLFLQMLSFQNTAAFLFLHRRLFCVEKIQDIRNRQFKIFSQITVICTTDHMIFYMVDGFRQLIGIRNWHDRIPVAVYQKNIFPIFLDPFIRFLISYVNKIPVPKSEPQQTVGFRNFVRRVKHSMDVIINAECRID